MHETRQGVRGTKHPTRKRGNTGPAANLVDTFFVRFNLHGQTHGAVVVPLNRNIHERATKVATVSLEFHGASRNYWTQNLCVFEGGRRSLSDDAVAHFRFSKLPHLRSPALSPLKTFFRSYKYIFFFFFRSASFHFIPGTRARDSSAEKAFTAYTYRRFPVANHVE